MYNAPCGIQVARIESLLFRLLKAVLIPITIKYFLFEVDWTVFKFPNTGESWCTDDSCISVAAAICRKLQKGYHVIIPCSWFHLCPKNLLSYQNLTTYLKMIHLLKVMTYTLTSFWLQSSGSEFILSTAILDGHDSGTIHNLISVFIIMACIY